MSFFDLLTAPQSLPFSLALLLFFLITIIEVILVWIGSGADFGVDLSIDLDAPSLSDASGGGLLDWLGIGRVPYLISLAGFLFCFGFLGLLIQDLQFEWLGTALPWPIVAAGCLIATLPAIRLLNRGLGRIWPKDVESSAVTQESLVGHEAVVVMGTVSNGEPGQIKVRDPHGTTHYGLALSDAQGDAFAPGERLLIVGRRGPTFLVIRHPNPSSTSPVSS
ncbi:MAG: DUF1449 family protein [Opitutaceae bacterium]|nr:DUF1449 family protein [Opitutaceae bacterium]